MFFPPKIESFKFCFRAEKHNLFFVRIWLQLKIVNLLKRHKVRQPLFCWPCAFSRIWGWFVAILRTRFYCFVLSLHKTSGLKYSPEQLIRQILSTCMCTDRYRCMSFIHKHTHTSENSKSSCSWGGDCKSGWRIQIAFNSMFSAARIESQTYQSRRCSTSVFKRTGPFITLIAWYSLCCQVDYKCPNNQSCVLLLPE